ncbi:MAG: hypothetical protein ACREIH_10070 [Nitrospiraceae bacterium]
MRALGQSLLPVLVTLMVAGMPVMASAGDRQNDNDRGGNRHSLIDHKALKAKLEALRDKIKELKERKHKHHGGSDGSLAALQAQVTGLEGDLAELTRSTEALLRQLGDRVLALETNGGGGGTIPPKLAALDQLLPENVTSLSDLLRLSQYLTVDPNPINGVAGPHVIFGAATKGVNVHIRNGSGDTGTRNGLGNLIVGYNEGSHPSQALGATRIGSHNIVGGTLNAFPFTGGLVLGSQNWINNPYATILGGENNQADGLASSILGGRANWTNATDGTVPSF